ncbi:hypothetical protein J3R83DRAFT_5328 [Lanmaoa asiatica]|nr:hypothetical protein J3R83DRAFT_5328 [Lanmaoa asiatica]
MRVGDVPVPRRNEQCQMNPDPARPPRRPMVSAPGGRVRDARRSPLPSFVHCRLDDRSAFFTAGARPAARSQSLTLRRTPCGGGDEKGTLGDVDLRIGENALALCFDPDSPSLVESIFTPGATGDVSRVTHPGSINPGLTGADYPVGVDGAPYLVPFHCLHRSHRSGCVVQRRKIGSLSRERCRIPWLVSIIPRFLLLFHVPTLMLSYRTPSTSSSASPIGRVTDDADEQLSKFTVGTRLSFSARRALCR